MSLAVNLELALVRKCVPLQDIKHLRQHTGQNITTDIADMF
jgi:hypothetical protein